MLESHSSLEVHAAAAREAEAGGATAARARAHTATSRANEERTVTMARGRRQVLVRRACDSSAGTGIRRSETAAKILAAVAAARAGPGERERMDVEGAEAGDQEQDEGARSSGRARAHSPAPAGHAKLDLSKLLDDPRIRTLLQDSPLALAASTTLNATAAAAPSSVAAPKSAAPLPKSTSGSAKRKHRPSQSRTSLVAPASKSATRAAPLRARSVLPHNPRRLPKRRRQEGKLHGHRPRRKQRHRHLQMLRLCYLPQATQLVHAAEVGAGAEAQHRGLMVVPKRQEEMQPRNLDLLSRAVICLRALALAYSQLLRQSRPLAA